MVKKRSIEVSVFNRDSCKALLLKGLKAMAVSLDSVQIDQLLRYLKEFLKWNKAYNLSAVKDPLDIHPVPWHC